MAKCFISTTLKIFIFQHVHGSSKHSLFYTFPETLAYKKHSQLIEETVLFGAVSFYAAVQMDNQFQPYDPSIKAHQALEIHYCHEYVKSFGVPVGYRQNTNFPNKIDCLSRVIVQIADGILHTAYPVTFVRELYIPHNSVQEWHITRNCFSPIAVIHLQKAGVTAVKNSSEEKHIQDNLEEKLPPDYSTLQPPKIPHLARSM